MTDFPQTMFGMQLKGHGGFDQLEYRTDIPTPTPETGDVLVRVLAAGVNNTDLNMRVGWYAKNIGDHDNANWTDNPVPFPLIQGIDVYGEIVAVGEGVSSARIGEHVLIEPCLREAHGQELDTPWFLGSDCDGGFAQFTVVASRHAYAVNSSLSAVELASFPCSYSTAENMLTRANLQQGEQVLITGASGGVGSAAVQLAKARDAYVLAVTSASKADAVRAIGADEIILRDEDLLRQVGQERVDVVIDLVAGAQWNMLLDMLKTGGRYAVSGAIAGPIVELDVRTLYLKDLSFFGCTALNEDVFANLVRYIEDSRIKPLIFETFALEQIAEAQILFEQKKHVGKIVLRVADQ